MNDNKEIKVGDRVAWEHDKSLHGKVIELVGNKYVDYAIVDCFGYDEPKYIMLDECVKL